MPGPCASVGVQHEGARRAVDRRARGSARIQREGDECRPRNVGIGRRRREGQGDSSSTVLLPIRHQDRRLVHLGVTVTVIVSKSLKRRRAVVRHADRDREAAGPWAPSASS